MKKKSEPTINNRRGKSICVSKSLLVPAVNDIEKKQKKISEKIPIQKGSDKASLFLLRRRHTSTFSIDFVKIDNFWSAPSLTSSHYIDNLLFVIILINNLLFVIIQEISIY